MYIISILILIGFFLIGVDETLTIACGIFAWAGKTPNKFNKDKFDKLGIYNIERGRDSCGVSFDGEVFIGINDTKLYTKFIKSTHVNPKVFPTVIGHTRQASYGNNVTVENAHPFIFSNVKKDGDFIFVHNGTLYNERELAFKYKIETTKTITSPSKYGASLFKYTAKRDKIDSEILGEIIHKHQNFKVLSDYKGSAATVFTNTKEPNTIYVFKGGSKKIHNGVIEEERPLFYYIETRNSLYISSLEESLYSIGGDETNVFSFETNVLYKITDGNIKQAETIKINRQDIISSKNTASWYKAGSYYDDLHFDCIDATYPTKQTSAKQTPVLELPSTTSTKKEEGLFTYLAENEKLAVDINSLQGKIYFHKFKYCRNGHPISGVYIWVPSYGFYFLTDDPKRLKSILEKIEGKAFDAESLSFVKRSNSNSKAIVPNAKTYEAVYYFYKGVRVETSLDYETLLAYKNPSDLQISHCSTHPIINSHNKLLYKKGHVVDSDIITLLGSYKTYHIKSGKITKEVVHNNLLKPFKEVKTKVDVKDETNDIFSETITNVSIYLEDSIDKLEEFNSLKNLNRPSKRQLEEQICALEEIKEYIEELNILI